jgi:hypothetical protein
LALLSPQFGVGYAQDYKWEYFNYFTAFRTPKSIGSCQRFQYDVALKRSGNLHAESAAVGMRDVKQNFVVGGMAALTYFCVRQQLEASQGQTKGDVLVSMLQPSISSKRRLQGDAYHAAGCTNKATRNYRITLNNKV